MASISLSRWHTGLCAIALACTIVVPWQFTVIAVLAVLCDLLFRQEREGSERQGNVAGELTRHHGLQEATSPRAVRLPLALVRLLGADCAECRGIGCQACAHTGLG